MSLLDWIVVAAYALGMLGIGVYFTLRAETASDFLLGGRRMSPWAVGLSLFSTLVSTISYLSQPGEMIQHGPMLYASMTAYPFIFAIVGWFLIPYFMTLQITSAYELLETRLGLSVRMTGATIFLTLRLLWMAVIINATTRVVLLPLMGLDQTHAWWVAATMGLVTVIYTSLGGLQAVVWTDVAQSFILLGGAVVSVVMITFHLGGVGEWWPREWASNWDPPVFGFDSTARVTFFAAWLSMLTWHVCTAGSDQMAIQRYLATRDTKAARRMYATSLVADVCVSGLLGCLGLALLAFFRTHPELLAAGQSISHNADQLFPRFIATSLPYGSAGLVIAGLLAAAMSSLSSGMNSSAAVITTDFLDRFGSKPTTDTAQLRRIQRVSWLVGIVIVALSTVVDQVQGNLSEVAFKVVNLLTAPLFGLFFMALFVRRATAFGTLVGAVAGIATVVAVNYWKELTGTPGISFLWSMPLGLIVQIPVGMVASLLPIGRPAKDFPKS